MTGTVLDEAPAVGAINPDWFGPMAAATEQIHAAGLRVAVYGMDEGGE
jgi:hypothetical protein